jgi:orotate phosphoribosyltransferase
MSVNLIPSQDSVMEILKETGALLNGHFVYPNGKHAAHYFQMPLAFRYYDTARVLAVGLSRLFRVEREISSRLPRVSVISPSPGGIPVAFGVREALSASQIYWAELESGKRMFRQYVKAGEVYPAIIVDDIVRSGKAIEETVTLVRDLGSEVIGIGSIVRFEDAPREIAGIPIKSLVEYDVNFYDTFEELQQAEGVQATAEEERVRF